MVARSFVKPNAGEIHIAKFSGNISTVLLPVKSILLNPVYSKGQVNINWKTEGEINSAYFEAQRSYNGIDFEPAGRVNSAVPNGGNAGYSIIDNRYSSNSSTIYYRIKAVDINGNITYSSIVTVRVNKEIAVSTWPNPFVNTVSFNYDANNASVLTINISDAGGRKVKTQSSPVSKGLNTLTVSGLKDIQPGNYFIEITDQAAGRKHTSMLVKF
jgi:hypothetical protein